MQSEPAAIPTGLPRRHAKNRVTPLKKMAGFSPFSSKRSTALAVSVLAMTNRGIAAGMGMCILAIAGLGRRRLGRRRLGEGAAWEGAAWEGGR